MCAVYQTCLNERIELDQAVIGQVQGSQHDCSIKDMYLPISSGSSREGTPVDGGDIS